MGRPMMSRTFRDEVAEVPMTPKTEPVEEDTKMCDVFVEKWSASNAFDPDSDEFWEGDIVHEAFIDVVDVHEQPSSPEPLSSDSSDDGHGISSDMSAEEREVARRAGNVTQQRRGAGAGLSTTVQIIRSMSTMSDATVVNTGAARTPRVVYQAQELPEPVAISPSMLSQLPSHPPSPSAAHRQGTLPELWSDLRHLSRSPLPVPTTPHSPSPSHIIMSPPPSVTPHIYNWDRPHYGPLVAPPSPSPIRSSPRRQRASTLAHRRRESLPTSVSLRG